MRRFKALPSNLKLSPMDEFWIEIKPQDNQLDKRADFSVLKLSKPPEVKTDYNKLPLYAVIILTALLGITLIVTLLVLMNNFYLYLGADPLISTSFLPYVLFPQPALQLKEQELIY